MDFVLFWDKDVPYGKLLQDICKKKKIPMFNSIEAIAACDNKMETYRILWEWNMTQNDSEMIPLIPTIAAPMTYANIGYTKLDFLDKVIETLEFPMIIKECFGSFGMQVYIARDKEDLIRYTKKLGVKPISFTANDTKEYRKRCTHSGCWRQGCGFDVPLFRKWRFSCQYYKWAEA